MVEISEVELPMKYKSDIGEEVSNEKDAFSEEMKILACDQCGEMFKTESVLQRHIDTFHNISPNSDYQVHIKK